MDLGRDEPAEHLLLAGHVLVAVVLDGRLAIV